MTGPQRHALERLEAAGRPLELNRQTARVLERSGYIKPAGGWRWQLTDSGRNRVRRDSRDRLEHARREEALRKMPDGGLELARRAHAWIEAHDILEDFRWRRYARHVTECAIAGVDAAPSGYGEDHDAQVARVVRSALRSLRDYDQARDVARRRGTGLTVAYTADPRRHAASRPRALEAARRDDGVVELETFAERRNRRRDPPDRPSA